MTSDEIQNINPSATHPDTWWLREIAYQLAVMNERNASGDQQAVDRMLKKVGLGSPVGAGSDTTVRDDFEVYRELYDAIRAYISGRELYPGTSQKFDRLQLAIDNCTRTTRPDPQTADLQPQKEQTLSIPRTASIQNQND